MRKAGWPGRRGPPLVRGRPEGFSLAGPGLEALGTRRGAEDPLTAFPGQVEVAGAGRLLGLCAPQLLGFLTADGQIHPETAPPQMEPPSLTERKEGEREASWGGAPPPITPQHPAFTSLSSCAVCRHFWAPSWLANWAKAQPEEGKRGGERLEERSQERIGGGLLNGHCRWGGQ